MHSFVLRSSKGARAPHSASEISSRWLVVRSHASSVIFKECGALFYRDTPPPPTPAATVAVMGVRVGGQRDNKKLGLECMYFHMAAHICAVTDRRHIVAAALLSAQRNPWKRGQTLLDVSTYSSTLTLHAFYFIFFFNF